MLILAGGTRSACPRCLEWQRVFRRGRIAVIGVGGVFAAMRSMALQVELEGHAPRVRGA
jgi:hypothetical protein